MQVINTLRNKISRYKYQLWVKKAKEEHKKGKTFVLKDKESVDKYLDAIMLNLKGGNSKKANPE